MAPMKYWIFVAFVAIIGSLVVALRFMLHSSQDNGDDDARRSRRMARALAFRVGFSILLFVSVLFSYFMGWIHPTGIPLR